MMKSVKFASDSTTRLVFGIEYVCVMRTIINCYRSIRLELKYIILNQLRINFYGGYKILQDYIYYASLYFIVYRISNI